MIKLALIGMGTVGRSILKILLEHKDYYNKEIGINYNFIAIFEYDGALINEKGLNLKEIVGNKNIRQLKDWKPGVLAINRISDLNVDIIIEATPVNPDTGEPALGHIMKSLASKKHVVILNKGPFYLNFGEIQKLAKDNNVSVGFESTVMSATPVIGIKDTIAGNRILRIVGVLNGTSNYILDRMASEGVSFELALKEAQEQGYAEANPSLDIDGYDAAGKLVILANHFLGWNKTIKDVKISGITKVNKDMIELAKNENMVIKQLAIAKDGELEVSLKLIPENSSLALSGTLNGLYLETELAGNIVITGKGAGGPEAAAGMIADIINISRRHKLS
jgi:homoserine dehydrogenase